MAIKKVIAAHAAGLPSAPAPAPKKIVRRRSRVASITRPERFRKYGQYEPYIVIDVWGLNFNLGSAVKNIVGAEDKSLPLTELRKAAQYLAWEIEKRERGTLVPARRK